MQNSSRIDWTNAAERTVNNDQFSVNLWQLNVGPGGKLLKIVHKYRDKTFSKFYPYGVFYTGSAKSTVGAV